MTKLKLFHWILIIIAIVLVWKGGCMFLGSTIDLPITLPTSLDECISYSAGHCYFNPYSDEFTSVTPKGTCPAERPTQWGYCDKNGEVIERVCCISSWIKVFNDDNGLINLETQEETMAQSDSATLSVRTNGIVSLSCADMLDGMPEDEAFETIELTQIEDNEFSLYLETKDDIILPQDYTLACIGELPGGDFHYSSEPIIKYIHIRLEENVCSSYLDCGAHELCIDGICEFVRPRIIHPKECTFDSDCIESAYTCPEKTDHPGEEVGGACDMGTCNYVISPENVCCDEGGFDYETEACSTWKEPIPWKIILIIVGSIIVLFLIFEINLGGKKRGLF